MTDTEKIAQWEEPPPSVKAPGSVENRYGEVVKALRDSKEQWALLAPRPTTQAAKSLAGNIRKGRVGAFTPPGAFEAVYSDNRVWVRYVGEPEDAPASFKAGKRPDPAVVRAWAQATGRPVSSRGRVSENLFRQWHEATQGESE
jgi:hypothetical protein